jgi:hypothetical protein
MTRHWLVRSSLFGFFACSLTVALSAQQPKPTFEVTSVKRGAPPQGRTFSIPNNIGPGGRFTSPYSLLSGLIEFAYDIRDVQLMGGPNWVRTDRFDVVASAGREVSRDDIRLMLQALLADRFRLVVRQERREMPTHALLVDRSDGQLVDQTGLTGEWFFRFSYAPDPGKLPPSATAGGLAPDPNSATFPTALREQLGLRLQATRGPVDILVIESVQQPTEN